VRRTREDRVAQLDLLAAEAADAAEAEAADAADAADAAATDSGNADMQTASSKSGAFSGENWPNCTLTPAVFFQVAEVRAFLQIMASEAWVPSF